MEKGRLSLINNLRTFVRLLFRPIAFGGLRDKIIFFTSVLSVALRKKIKLREKLGQVERENLDV